MSFNQVKQVAKENGIKKVSHLNRSQLITLLISKGIEIPEREPRVKRVKAVVTEVDPIYERLRTIRTNPKRVRLTDTNTNEVKEFGCLYAAGKFLNHSSKIIHDYNGRVYKHKWKVEIIS